MTKFPVQIYLRRRRNKIQILGKRSKNLPSKIITQIDYPNLKRTETTTYTYQKDGKGNVSNMKLTISTSPFDMVVIKNEAFQFP